MTAPILYWIRRDFRLSDNPALTAAVQAGVPVIPIFIRDTLVDDLGAAPKWRLVLGLGHLVTRYRALGSDIILRTGDAHTVIQELMAETGATSVYWSRAYDPQAIDRDRALKSTLREQGIDARSFGGHLLFEPWSVETKTGGMYRVYTPFWNAVRGRDVDAPLPTVANIPAPEAWPRSEDLQSWDMGRAMQRGAAVVAAHVTVGEEAAQARLAQFCANGIARYKDLRDIPSVAGTSGLSENLALGEISPHQCWHAGHAAHIQGAAGAETFLKEVVWREFAYHLMYHTPHLLDRNWRDEWDQFPWNTDDTHPHVVAWKQGRTGIPFVDAAMREMYVTGRMHNRGRMIVASYLTKHLMTHWRIGQKWFKDCLVDWDPASNAMGWQWAAGSGPDAAPYFRVFNPVTQLDKFDPKGAYQRQWIAEGPMRPTVTASSYFDAIPRAWGMAPTDRYPPAIVSPAEGRERALAAYAARGEK